MTAPFDFAESIQVAVPRGSALQVSSRQASDGSIDVDEQVTRQAAFTSAPNLVLDIGTREVSVGGGPTHLRPEGHCVAEEATQCLDFANTLQGWAHSGQTRH